MRCLLLARQCCVTLHACTKMHVGALCKYDQAIERLTAHRRLLARVGQHNTKPYPPSYFTASTTCISYLSKIIAHLYKPFFAQSMLQNKIIYTLCATRRESYSETNRPADCLAHCNCHPFINPPHPTNVGQVCTTQLQKVLN